MKSLCVLITNHALVDRAGTELYVRDVAGALIARGHRPVVYSPVLGGMSLELRSATIPVVDDLDTVGEVPDVIHGQHHLEAMTAMLRFPRVPAVFLCHGWIPWEEAPPRFPRILRYVAVDRLVFDRLVMQHSIPPEQVVVLHNFVDLGRFGCRPPLPASPRRALLLSNEDGRHVAVIRAACERRGIALDVRGRDFGNSVAPETILPEYDLVFGKARTALEAMAVGTAVVLAGAVGMGPIVTSQDLDRLQQLNFGIRALRHPFDADVLGREIDRYDADDAAEVSRRIRSSASLDAVADRLVSLYRDVIREWSSPGADGSEEPSVATSRYLRWLSTHLKSLESTRQSIAARVAGLERDVEHLRAECERLTADGDRVRAERDALSTVEAEREISRHPLATAQGALPQMEGTVFWKARRLWRKMTLSR